MNEMEDREMMRCAIASRAMAALIRIAPNSSKKKLCDNAIAYADMLLRRLRDIPEDAQERSEKGQRNG